MKLFCKQYSENGVPLIILHGLFGNQGNWGQHAKFFAETYKVYGFDHRNHGRSEWDNSMAYEDMANDVRETMQLHGIEKAHFIGHSMGGETAMQVALNWPHLVDKLVLVDIAPVQYQGHHTAVFAGLDILNLDLIENRADADEILAEHIVEKGVRDFLLTNLMKDAEGKYSWRMNLDVIRKDYEKLNDSIHSENTFENRTLFVKGELSDYVLQKYEKAIFSLFPNADIQEVKDAGHWVHAQQPAAFQDLVDRFLKH
jgi:esterase